jgi:Protein of unknown function (DUF2975)
MLRVIRVFLWTGIAFVAFGTSLGLAAIVQSASAGQAAQTTLPLQIEPAPAEPVFDRTSAKPVGRFIVDHGTLNVRAGGSAYAGLQAIDVLLTGALWLLILVGILRLARQFSDGQPFEMIAVRRLRLVGWSMIGLNSWMWLRMLVLPPVLLSSLKPLAGGYHILPAVSEGVAGARNARVDTTLGFGLLAAGMLILVLAETFRAGTALREDSEAIV